MLPHKKPGAKNNWPTGTASDFSSKCALLQLLWYICGKIFNIGLILFYTDYASYLCVSRLLAKTCDFRSSSIRTASMRRRFAISPATGSDCCCYRYQSLGRILIQTCIKTDPRIFLYVNPDPDLKNLFWKTKIPSIILLLLYDRFCQIMLLFNNY